MSSTTVIAHSGPLPSVETLEGYERVLAGSADRVVTMAEREQKHRHRMEIADRLLSLFSRVTFVVMALAILGIAFYMIQRGQTLQGLIALVVELTAFAGTYLWAQRRGQG